MSKSNQDSLPIIHYNWSIYDDPEPLKKPIEPANTYSKTAIFKASDYFPTVTVTAPKKSSVTYKKDKLGFKYSLRSQLTENYGSSSEPERSDNNNNENNLFQINEEQGNLKNADSDLEQEADGDSEEVEEELEITLMNQNLGKDNSSDSDEASSCSSYLSGNDLMIDLGTPSEFEDNENDNDIAEIEEEDLNNNNNQETNLDQNIDGLNNNNDNLDGDFYDFGFQCSIRTCNNNANNDDVNDQNNENEALELVLDQNNINGCDSKLADECFMQEMIEMEMENNLRDAADLNFNELDLNSSAQEWNLNDHDDDFHDHDSCDEIYDNASNDDNDNGGGDDTDNDVTASVFKGNDNENENLNFENAGECVDLDNDMELGLEKEQQDNNNVSEGLILGEAMDFSQLENSGRNSDLTAVGKSKKSVNNQKNIVDNGKSDGKFRARSASDELKYCQTLDCPEGDLLCDKIAPNSQVESQLQNLILGDLEKIELPNGFTVSSLINQYNKLVLSGRRTTVNQNLSANNENSSSQSDAENTASKDETMTEMSFSTRRE